MAVATVDTYIHFYIKWSYTRLLLLYAHAKWANVSFSSISFSLLEVLFAIWCCWLFCACMHIFFLLSINENRKKKQASKTVKSNFLKNLDSIYIIIWCMRIHGRNAKNIKKLFLINWKSFFLQKMSQSFVECSRKLQIFIFCQLLIKEVFIKLFYKKLRLCICLVC